MAAPEVIIVLGCRTNADGTASEMMRYRVKQAANVYKSFVTDDDRNTKHPWVIVTGYQAPGDQIITEAKAMLNYIHEEKLLPTEHVILEEQATNTEGNAYWSRIIVDNIGANEIHVVTTPFHLKRSQDIFEKIFSTHIYNLHFHGSLQEFDEETTKYRKEREEMLSCYIDRNIADIPFHIKVSPNGKPIILLYSPVIKNTIFKHGFTTRFGGVSTYKTLSSLNLMFNPNRRDPKVNIDENRWRLAIHCDYDIQQFYMAKCIHGNGVWVIGDPEPASYDALVSNKPGITIAAPGADCSILLFCDPVRNVCAAAHSGWRGTLANISHCVLNVMTKRFDCNIKNINVAIGPTIGPCCFEVGEEVAQQFMAVCTDVVVRKENAPKPFVDLRKTTRFLLENYGILPQNIDDSSREFEGIEPCQRVTQCTYCDSQQRFFSYRRDGSQYGTQIGWITVKPQNKKNQEKCVI